MYLVPIAGSNIPFYFRYFYYCRSLFLRVEAFNFILKLRIFFNRSSPTQLIRHSLKVLFSAPDCPGDAVLYVSF